MKLNDKEITFENAANEYFFADVEIVSFSFDSKDEEKSFRKYLDDFINEMLAEHHCL